MIYENKIKIILNQFGVNTTYKGYHYIISSMQFIHKHESTFLPITKNLYIDIAKQHRTSDKCIEKNIRKVIEIIWKQKNNFSLICKIFGENNVSKRLGNTQFLILLYEYIVSHTEEEIIANLYQDKIPFLCPFQEIPCEFYNKFMYDIINKKKV